MIVVENTVRWRRLCELVNAPLQEYGYQYSMAEVTDSLKAMGSGVSIFAVSKNMGVNTNIREYYELAGAWIERLITGEMTSRPEFYMRLTPTIMTAADTIAAKNRLRESLKRLKQHRELPMGHVFKTLEFFDVSTPETWEESMRAVYSLSRLAGMRDEIRYDTLNDAPAP